MKRHNVLTTGEKQAVRQIVFERTGYGIKSTTILNQILRRSSFAAEQGLSSNEILEFIGDQVLSYYVIKLITNRCGSLNPLRDYVFRIKENQFTQIKQDLVNNEALAAIMDEWGLARFLFLGKSDIINDAAKETKVKADLLEAVIGGIAIDCDWDPHVLESAVQRSLGVDAKLTALMEADPKVVPFDLDTAITTLKELAESGRCSMPEYVFSGPDNLGYDEDGNPRWMCRCRIINEQTGLSILVAATSKKDAKKAAAYLILCRHFETQNQYGPNDWYLSWIYKDGRLFPDRKPAHQDK